jgi:hypothetical protein
LGDALRLWRRFDADPESVHPIDRGAEAPGANFIITNIVDRPFQPWDEFRTNIRPSREAPLYVQGAVDTYYHAWQVLLVADALEMGVHLIFDTRKRDLFDLALNCNFAELPGDAVFRSMSFEGPRGLNNGVRWAQYFDASAQIETIRIRKLSALSVNVGDDGFLSETQRVDLDLAQRRVAEHVFASIGATRQQIRAYLAYLCERWDEWTSRGRAEVASEYKRQIGFAIRAARYAFNLSFETLASDVGQVTGHDANTLDAIFPDWTHDAREKLAHSLKHRIVAHAPRADANLTLDDADVTDFLDWLERRGQWKIHLTIEVILERQFSGSAVDHSALAKEVEALSATFEHLVNDLLVEAGVNSPEALMKKMQRFWSALPEVHTILKTHYNLTGTKAFSRATQLAGIASLPATGANMDVARVLLVSVLYRNDGLHNSMVSWSEAELHEATRIFLTAAMFCRKNLLTNPPS